MHVLIISSEELYKDNIMPSVFELAQAKALKQKNIKVALIVINVPYTFMGLLKHMFFYVAGIRSYNAKYAKPFAALAKLFFKRLWKYTWPGQKDIHAVDTIEGIEVYSTTIIPFTSRYTIKNFISRWENSALNLFRYYSKKNGIPDIIHAHSRFLYAGHFAFIIKKTYKIKYVLSEHSSYYTTMDFSSVIKGYVREMIEEASKYMPVSESMVPFIKQKAGLPNLDYTVLPNILDETFENFPSSKSQDSDGSFYIINIASFHPNKGHDLLLKAFARSFKKYKHVKLKLVGEGLKEGLTSLCVELGIEEQIIFTGKIDNKKLLIQELDKASFFVLSSSVETFGVVVIEALSRGLPVVSTRCGGPEEVITTTNGLLVDNNAEALSEGMNKMMNEYHHYDSVHIRNEAIRLYGNQAIGEALINTYHNALNT